ncbi:MAG: prolyl aminopeptidase [Deltaproteobacteria bacterium]|nr:prolyl aminopeptidase [Deltaproteobacteria bacterium]
MRELYPEIELFNSFELPVSELHTIYVEESGNPDGKPVIFVHGGPGGGTEPKHRRYFDPQKWRIILFDQRGCGKSKPFSCLEENTTWDLVADMEKIREKLNINKWHVFGGSWGSTLALAYAEKHPDKVLGLILRGIFLMRKSEINWFYQFGASEIYPDAWDDFLKPIPEAEHGDLLNAYHKRLTSTDESVVTPAAIAWSTWEGRTSRLITEPDFVATFEDPKFAHAFARIECHYFKNKGFFEEDGWLLKNVPKIADIPAVIVQGRYDMPCPLRSAWDLSKAWPKAELVVLPDAGHSASEPGIMEALVDATDRI